MQINTSINTDHPDHRSTLSVLWSRIISNVYFYLIQNTLVVILQTESRLVSDNQLTQITWQSFENQLAQNMRKIFAFSTPSSLDRMACYQRNLPIDVRALRPLWWNVLRTVWLDTLRPVSKKTHSFHLNSITCFTSKRTVCIKYWSTVAVVAGRWPYPSRSLTHYVSWDPVLIKEMALFATSTDCMHSALLC